MAFDEKGNFYFDPSDFEDQAALEKIRREEGIRTGLKNQQIAVDSQTAYNKNVESVLSEFGLTGQSFTEMLQGNPDVVKKVSGKMGGKTARKIIEEVSRKTGKGPVPVQQQGRQKAGSYEKMVTSAKEKASKTGAVSDDELIDILGAIL